MIPSLSRKELEERGCIVADTVKEARLRYVFRIFRTGDCAKMWEFLRKVWSLSSGFFYADFYYPSLKLAEKRVFEQGLCKEEQEMLARFETDKNQVYFPVEQEEILKFLYGITARNWLFSSFYIADKKAIIWGNYDLCFPVFCQSEQQLEQYIILGKECGLECQI